MSASLGEARSLPAGDLTAALAASLDAAPAVVASADLPASAQSPERVAAWLGEGAIAADLETAGLLAFGQRLGVSVAAVLLVCESERGRLDDPEAETRLVGLGAELALALSDLPARAAGR